MKDVRAFVIAAACHSAWFAYTVLGLGEEGEPWATAPDWQRASILDGVKFWDGLMDEQEATGAPAELVHSWALLHLPALSHDNWLKHKHDTGWVYGKVKDPEKKTHPCMVPYGDLPEDQRKKDRVVIEAYLAVRGELDV